MIRGFRTLLPILLCLLASFALAQEAGVPGSKPFVPDNRWAIVIGVSKYLPEVGPLKYSAKEARDFAATLTGDLGFEPDRVALLADDVPDATQPTSKNILAKLDALLGDRRLDKGNLFVFYFSGHGVATPKGDFLIPADAGVQDFERLGIPVREVISRIVGAGLKNVLFLTDACRAGTENDFGGELTSLCHDANLAVILGCAPGRRSYESARLRKGVFTHFLIEALRNKDLRDTSGTIWASAIGKDLRTRVQEFTARDYGKYAQVPYTWGEDSTLDVLLATHPQPPVSEAALGQFKERAGQLDKPLYAAALSNYAQELLLQDESEKAIDLLKVVDQLGELGDSGRFLLGSSLQWLGRSGEAERAFAPLLDRTRGGYYRDLALVSSVSRSLSPQSRTEAAKRLYAAGRSWTEKNLARATVDRWGRYEDKLKLARTFAKDSPPGRTRLFADAYLAEMEGRWRDALLALDKARATLGAKPPDLLLFYAKVRPLASLGSATEFAKFADQATKLPGCEGFGYLYKAQRRKDAGDLPGRMENLKRAFAYDLDPEQIWLAVRIAGPYVGSLSPGFKAAAAKHPYSWRAHIVLAFLCQIAGDNDGAQHEMQAMERYCDEPLNFKATLYDFMYGFMTEAVSVGTLTEDKYREQLDTYFLSLLEDVSKFGYDPDLWMQLTTYGLFNERSAQMRKIAASYLPANPASAPRELRPMLLMLSLNVGDRTSSAKLLDSALEPTERNDAVWFRAMFEAAGGRPQEAAKLLEAAPKPSAALSERTEALRTYLMARTAKGDLAKKRLATKSADTVVRGLQGLAWAALGDWKRAEPLLEEQVVTRVWGLLFLQELAIRELDAHYRARKDLAGARRIAMSALISQPGNPLFDRYSFVATPGVGQFAGSVQMAGVAIGDRADNARGTLAFTVSTGGELAGSFTTGEGKTHPFRGKIDGRGNVTGTGEWAGEAYELSGKIAPCSLYKTYEGFKTQGQLLQLIDKDGYRIALLGRTGA